MRPDGFVAEFRTAGERRYLRRVVSRPMRARREGSGLSQGLKEGELKEGEVRRAGLGFWDWGDGAGGGAWSMARPTFSQRIARISSGVVFGSRARLVSRRS